MADNPEIARADGSQLGHLDGVQQLIGNLVDVEAALLVDHGQQYGLRRPAVGASKCTATAVCCCSRGMPSVQLSNTRPATASVSTPSAPGPVSDRIDSRSASSGGRSTAAH